MDLSGREWLDEEFELLRKKGLITLEQVDVVDALIQLQGKYYCQRCLNDKQNHFAKFYYQGKEIIYCRDCLNFKLVSSESQLYRSKVKSFILPEVSQLNVAFKLSFLQQRASDFTKGLLETGETGIVWAVCDASV